MTVDAATERPAPVREVPREERPTEGRDTAAPLLSIRDLRIEYRTDRGIVSAVDGASLEVPRGKMVGLVGESGCGKTTVARGITRVLPRNARIAGGSIVFQGRDLVPVPEAAMRELRWRAISFVPQSAMNSLDPVYRLGRQIAEVLRRGGRMSAGAQRERAVTLLDMVGLDAAVLDAYPHQLSGGMRQRGAIALALALDPDLMIADEPVTALDVIVQREVLDTLRRLQTALGLSVIMVTHDVSVVAYCCDIVVVMYAGQVIESGATDAVLGRPRHPYTMGLYNAFPDLERAAGTLVPIPGYPPDLHAPPTGCRFAPRCPFAVERCRVEAPPLVESIAGHYAACWRSGEAPILRQQAAQAETWQALA